jgi:hypothetical protein
LTNLWVILPVCSLKIVIFPDIKRMNRNRRSTRNRGKSPIVESLDISDYSTDEEDESKEECEAEATQDSVSIQPEVQ